MRIKSLMVSLLGIAVAGGSVYFAKEFLLEEDVVYLEADGPEMIEVLVASVDVPFGDPIESGHIKTLAWPKDAVPAGVFLERDAVLPTDGGEPRRARSKLYAGELLLEAKLSDFGEKVTIVQKLGPNMRAIALNVNASSGVGGFVTPGDHVDIVMTRGSGDTLRTVTILQNVRVIGVDQTASENHDSPSVARTITVEVTPDDGQKLALAQSAGKLSLTLRTADQVVDEPMAMIRLRDILQEEGPVPMEEAKSLVTVRRGSAAVEEVEVN